MKDLSSSAVSIISPTRTGSLIILSACLLMAVKGFEIFSKDPLIGSVLLLLFGLFFILIGIRWILKLDSLYIYINGFVFYRFFKKKTHYWSDIDFFEVAFVGRFKKAVFKFNELGRSKNFRSLEKSWIFDNGPYDGSLPVLFGTKPEDLVVTLEAYKKEFKARGLEG